MNESQLQYCYWRISVESPEAIKKNYSTKIDRKVSKAREPLSVFRDHSVLVAGATSAETLIYPHKY